MNSYMQFESFIKSSFGEGKDVQCNINMHSQNTFSVEVPILDRLNDFIEFHVEILPESQQARFSDAQFVYNSLLQFGIDINNMGNQWQKVFLSSINRYGASYDPQTKEVYELCHFENIKREVVFFPQALAIADFLVDGRLAYQQENNNIDYFTMQMKNIFTANRYKYKDNVTYKGNSGIDVKFNFSVENKSKNVLVSLLHNNDEKSKKALLFDWKDVKGFTVDESSNLVVVEKQDFEKTDKQHAIRKVMRASGMIFTTFNKAEGAFHELVG